MPICVDGKQWYVAEEYTFNNTTEAKTLIGKIYKEGANGVPSAILPIGIIIDGTCDIPTQQTLRSGGVSIAEGTFATTLGPDGTTWTNTGNLRSITVRARRSNNNDTVPGSGANQVMIQVTYNNGKVKNLDNLPSETDRKLLIVSFMTELEIDKFLSTEEAKKFCIDLKLKTGTNLQNCKSLF